MKFQFAYWSRYLSRLLRHNMEYRGEMMGWKFTAPRFAFALADRKENEIRESRFHPLWRFSEQPPWDMVNTSSSYPFMDQIFTVEYPSGKKIDEKLNPILPEEQMVFKGDQVKVLVGPDKGKVGTVASVLKMRRLVLVHNMNYRIFKDSMGASKMLRRIEMPLHVETEVALIDPSDQEPCSAEWRLLESTGKRMRISMRTGREIPLPSLADQLDDLTVPSVYVADEKDTRSDKVCEVTYKAHLRPFEEEVLQSMGVNDPRKRAKTFWY